MSQILIVEDNPLFGSVVQKMLQQQLQTSVVLVKSFAEARECIDNPENSFDVALLDLNLPDAEMGEAVDYAVACGLPGIVFTSRFSPELHESIWSKGVVDYVLKEGPDSLNYIAKQIRRLKRNPFIKVLVVDDSRTVREYLEKLLRIHRFQVLTAENGEQALALVKKHSDLSLMLVDYTMPGMDGFELIRKVRRKYSQNDMAIIGLSSREDRSLSAKFLKHGANDYTAKPFSRDEFYCRVHQNIDMLISMREIRDRAERDYLTDLYNRRYFFDHWGHFIDKKREIAVAMLDIDFFKKVNDTYGHDAGDEVLRGVAKTIGESQTSKCLVARFGGEEFCMLFNATAAFANEYLNDLCHKIGSKNIEIADGQTLNVTISVGMYCGELLDLDDMLKISDQKLYQAKENGRNQVVL
ncbi:MAG: diguanylate cyclase [Desulfuromonadaceae bacterium]